MVMSAAVVIDYKEMIFEVLGGLGIFLFGISFMGEALKLIAGDKMKEVIEKYTSNPLKGALVGILVTGIIQSSSGTTALTIGLVRAGIMSLNQAIGIIMGANIGTTVTAFLIGFKLTDYALPILAFGGFMYMFSQRKNFKLIGQAIFGFGALFFGLELMGSSLKGLAELQTFKDLMIDLAHNPFLGVLVGTGMTLIIQSSSATIGILQTIYDSNAITLHGALPILFGDNIGTTITAVLAAIGGSLAARRASAAHVFFNVTGAILFLSILPLFQKYIVFMTDHLHLDKKMQIAFAHATFNITMTIILLPFANQIANAVRFILPGKDDTEHDQDEELLNPGLITQSTTLAIGQAKNAVIHTGRLVVKALMDLELYVTNKDRSALDSVYSVESIIDSLDVKIRKYLVALTSQDLSDHETRDIQVLLQTLKDFERMGDHCENLAQLFEAIYENNEALTEDATKDFTKMYNSTLEIVKLAINALEKNDKVLSGIVIEKENNIDRLEKKARQRHVYRVSEHLCSGLISAVYVDLLNNLERISDHASNIAEYIVNVEKDAKIDYHYLGALFEEIDSKLQSNK